MLVPLFVPMAGMAMIFGVVAAICGLISTGMLHRSLREAMKTSPESVPALTAALRSRSPWADALLGWVAIALGAVIVVLGLFEREEIRTEFFKASIIPFVIGIVVLVYLRFARPPVA